MSLSRRGLLKALAVLPFWGMAAKAEPEPEAMVWKYSIDHVTWNINDVDDEVLYDDAPVSAFSDFIRATGDAKQGSPEEIIQELNGPRSHFINPKYLPTE